jgi:hypothetical protein
MRFLIDLFSGESYGKTDNMLIRQDDNIFNKIGDNYIDNHGVLLTKFGNNYLNTDTGAVSSFGNDFLEDEL